MISQNLQVLSRDLSDVEQPCETSLLTVHTDVNSRINYACGKKKTKYEMVVYWRVCFIVLLVMFL